MSMSVGAKRQSHVRKLERPKGVEKAESKGVEKAERKEDKATKAVGHPQQDKFQANGATPATASTGAAGVSGTSAASASKPGELTKEQQEAGWKKEASLIKQDPGSTDCGPAVGAMLVRAAGGGGNASDEELVKEMGGGNGQKGLEPDELAEKLARQGLKTEYVSDMADKNDAKALLNSGHKLVAQVDSAALHAAAEGKPPPAGAGSAHYVMVDGVTADGRLRVKDPAANTTYTVSQEQLQDAVAASRVNHGGGGLMAVRPDANAYADWVANKPQNQQVMAGTMGDEPAIGASRRTARIIMF